MKRLVPESLQHLVDELSRLPGVGERSALRYAISLLRGGTRRMEALSQALHELQLSVDHCPKCHFWQERSSCPLCSDASRSLDRLCVVRDCPDVLALEKSRRQEWSYHILQGLLSPLAGIGPNQIRLASLMERVQKDGVQEVILALDATLEGDATALWIRDLFKKEAPGVRVTRTALGLPAGSSVEYLDASTLESAILHRTQVE